MRHYTFMETPTWKRSNYLEHLEYPKEKWTWQDEQRQVWDYIHRINEEFNLSVEADRDGAQMFKEVEVLGNQHRVVRRLMSRLQAVCLGIREYQEKAAWMTAKRDWENTADYYEDYV